VLVRVRRNRFGVLGDDDDDDDDDDGSRLHPFYLRLHSATALVSLKLD
jgi:hypothetical protein